MNCLDTGITADFFPPHVLNRQQHNHQNPNNFPSNLPCAAPITNETQRDRKRVRGKIKKDATWRMWLWDGGRRLSSPEPPNRRRSWYVAGKGDKGDCVCGLSGNLFSFLFLAWNQQHPTPPKWLPPLLLLPLVTAPATTGHREVVAVGDVWSLLWSWSMRIET